VSWKDGGAIPDAEELAQFEASAKEIETIRARNVDAYAHRLAELGGEAAAPFVPVPDKVKAIAEQLKMLLPFVRPQIEALPEPLRTIVIGVEALIEEL